MTRRSPAMRSRRCRCALTRAELVRYAGASGDFNPIHWNERFAVGVGLPDVIAHGMLTMALAGRLVTSWTGDPGGRGRLRGPLHPARRGARRRRRRRAGGLRHRQGGRRRWGVEGGVRIATVAITAAVDGKTVLARATARVRLPA